MNYHDIYECDVNNGKGVRVTLFVSGCDHGCKGCYNTETWNTKSGKLYTEEVEDHIISLLKDEELVRQGLSLSGGDPLHPNNVDMIIRLINRVRKECPTKDIWLWSGYTLEHILETYYKEKPTFQERWNATVWKQIIDSIDVFIDGKFEQDKHKANLKWRGSENQIIHVFRETKI